MDALTVWCGLVQVKQSQMIADLKEVMPSDPGRVDRLVKVTKDPYVSLSPLSLGALALTKRSWLPRYEAMSRAHAIAVLTEWDEFKGLLHQRKMAEKKDQQEKNSISKEK